MKQEENHEDLSEERIPSSEKGEEGQESDDSDSVIDLDDDLPSVTTNNDEDKTQDLELEGDGLNMDASAPGPSKEVSTESKEKTKKRPSNEKINKILKKRYEMKILLRELETREVIGDDEEENCKDQQMIKLGQEILRIERKLYGWGVLTYRDEDKAWLSNDNSSIRIQITDTGIPLLNERLTAELKSKKTGEFDDPRAKHTLDRDQLTSICESVRAEQLRLDEKTAIPAKDDPKWEDFLGQLSEKVHQAVRSATIEYFEGDGWNSYLKDEPETEDEQKTLAAIRGLSRNVGQGCSVEEYSMRFRFENPGCDDYGGRDTPGEDSIDVEDEREGEEEGEDGETDGEEDEGVESAEKEGNADGAPISNGAGDVVEKREAGKDKVTEGKVTADSAAVECNNKELPNSEKKEKVAQPAPPTNVEGKNEPADLSSASVSPPPRPLSVAAVSENATCDRDSPAVWSDMAKGTSTKESSIIVSSSSNCQMVGGTESRSGGVDAEEGVEPDLNQPTTILVATTESKDTKDLKTALSQLGALAAGDATAQVGESRGKEEGTREAEEDLEIIQVHVAATPEATHPARMKRARPCLETPSDPRTPFATRMRLMPREQLDIREDVDDEIQIVGEVIKNNEYEEDVGVINSSKDNYVWAWLNSNQVKGEDVLVVDLEDEDERGETAENKENGGERAATEPVADAAIRVPSRTTQPGSNFTEDEQPAAKRARSQNPANSSPLANVAEPSTSRDAAKSTANATESVADATKAGEMECIVLD